MLVICDSGIHVVPFQMPPPVTMFETNCEYETAMADSATVKLEELPKFTVMDVSALIA
jgi:hypothetical protein